MVKASDAVPREAANSVCTTGNTTTTDHMPTLPSEPIRTATAKRVHARRESGTNSVEFGLRGEAIATAAATSLAPAIRSSAMARYWACRCSATELGAARHRATRLRIHADGWLVVLKESRSFLGAFIVRNQFFQ